jgi:signal transduction histidine kinase
VATIRGRLTLGYAVTLAASVAALTVALYLERRASAVRELDRRLALEADLAVQFLSQSYVMLGRVVRRAPPAIESARDSLQAERLTLEPGVSAYLEGVRDYLLVVGREGGQLYLTESTRALSYPVIVDLLRVARPGDDTVSTVGTLPAGSPTGPLRWVVRRRPDDGSGIGSVVAAAPISDVPFGPGELLRSILLVSPMILLGSLALGYWQAGRGLRPLQQMTEELEAITDGRSLHRRLAVAGGARDEVSRLGATVNGMLARLEQSFASLRRFTADASHELKTPLMVLRAGVERALTHPAAPPESLESLDETLDQINQMTELVDALLTLARADEGRAPLAVEPHDIAALLTEAAETAEILGAEAGISVSVDRPTGPVILEVDADRIRQLLLNLVTNAVKYTPPGGRVALGLDDRGWEVALTVADSGVGIAAGDLPHIFDRFWRADVARSRTGDRAGAGLGLAITKWIAEAHGGTIAVQSRPNRGTSFTVLFPRGREAPAEAPGEAGAAG